jgi:hypothetical protein
MVKCINKKENNMKKLIFLMPLAILMGCGVKFLEKRFDHRDILSQRYNKDKKINEKVHVGPCSRDKKTKDEDKENGEAEITWWKWWVGDEE